MRREGFSLIELLVVIAIIAILAAILFPVFLSAKEKSRQATCMSNMKQCAVGISLYSQDNNDNLPLFAYSYNNPNPDDMGWWYDTLQKYLKNRNVLKCPSAAKLERGYGVNYGHNGGLFGYGDLRTPVKIAALRRPSRLIAITDSTSFAGFVYCPAEWKLDWDYDKDGMNDTYRAFGRSGMYNGGAPFRHNGGSSCAFVDGHAQWVPGAKWLTDMSLWDARL